MKMGKPIRYGVQRSHQLAADGGAAAGGRADGGAGGARVAVAADPGRPAALPLVPAPGSSNPKPSGLGPGGGRGRDGLRPTQLEAVRGQPGQEPDASAASSQTHGAARARSRRPWSGPARASWFDVRRRGRPAVPATGLPTSMASTTMRWVA